MLDLAGQLLGFIGGIGPMEMVIIGIIAVVLFGKNLPNVARQLGGSYREFRRGLDEFKTHVESVDRYTPPNKSVQPYRDYDDYEAATAPKFEPPISEPQESTPPAGDSTLAQDVARAGDSLTAGDNAAAGTGATPA